MSWRRDDPILGLFGEQQRGRLLATAERLMGRGSRGSSAPAAGSGAG
jgi:hypothetical protein